MYERKFFPKTLFGFFLSHTYTVLGNTTVFIFDNLYGYADYNISVAAFNKYPGVVSETIQLKTPEKSKLFVWLIYFSVYSFKTFQHYWY